METLLHPQGVGRGCPRKGEAVVVKPLKRQQPRTKADESATTTLSRAYESLRSSCPKFPYKTKSCAIMGVLGILQGIARIHETSEVQHA
jgi:hypothetical protein